MSPVPKFVSFVSGSVGTELTIPDCSGRNRAIPMEKVQPFAKIERE